MATVQTNYPSADTVALTISLNSLASSTTLVAGRESTAVDNTTNLDLDHLLSGVIRLGGATPTVNKTVEVWAYAPIKIVSGTPTYPDVLDGTDSAETITSASVKYSAMRLVHSMNTDATIGLDLFIPPTSIASLFGELPPYWGIFVTHDSGVALDSTAGNHYLHYMRVRRTVA
jgi:hypothetical protein